MSASTFTFNCLFLSSLFGCLPNVILTACPWRGNVWRGMVRCRYEGPLAIACLHTWGKADRIQSKRMAEEEERKGGGIFCCNGTEGGAGKIKKRAEQKSFFFEFAKRKDKEERGRKRIDSKV